MCNGKEKCTTRAEGLSCAQQASLARVLPGLVPDPGACAVTPGEKAAASDGPRVLVHVL